VPAVTCTPRKLPPSLLLPSLPLLLSLLRVRVRVRVRRGITFGQCCQACLSTPACVAWTSTIGHGKHGTETCTFFQKNISSLTQCSDHKGQCGYGAPPFPPPALLPPLFSTDSRARSGCAGYAPPPPSSSPAPPSPKWEITRDHMLGAAAGSGAVALIACGAVFCKTCKRKRKGALHEGLLTTKAKDAEAGQAHAEPEPEV
jgi:hypothetical protein